MSIKRRQLFVGLLDKEIWTNEKLRAYFIKHASTNNDQYIIDCEIMSYGEARFKDKSFAFITFNDNTCVDHCMAQRKQFNDEYGITIKRLLPDSITKCERLTSSTDIVIRLDSADSSFTDSNLRSYFGVYGTIVDIKMLEEDDTACICLLTFENFDSSDRVLLDAPHYLNNQLLSIHKYTAPEYLCNLSQFRFINETHAREIKRWYPIFRNLTDFIGPYNIICRTQLALVKCNMNRQILIGNENLNKTKENLLDSQNRYKTVKQDFIKICNLNEQLNKQIDETVQKNDITKAEYEKLIEAQRKRNQSLRDSITN